ncbi:MAG: bifunctional phosphoribosylaminoimidazolecarboxamide formyltransferase/IMP cyclohydrolase [Rhizobiales bacterium]|nr:bifunctional phosphoribosylaminoimidazolecarboxamide formyltransferase/IMP cyclohydrolase [Hyphomicrobiales bacterium]
MNTIHHTIQRALISVSDKSGLIEFASALAAAGIELVSTGGTARAIAEAGIEVRDVSDLTSFPEMMDGRVKTLHPVVHGGILSVRGNAEHEAVQKEHAIGNIDLVVVNLYPFEQTVARNAGYDEAIENIDIGGPAMIRSAAKNHAAVTVVIEPEDYQRVLDEIAANNGATTYETRQHLAAKAYARTSAYDAAISNWFAAHLDNAAPDFRGFGGRLAQSLRYGENPHQKAAFYRDGTARPGVATARQVQGKELSYNNINDTDAAFECVAEFPADKPAVAIIKHANPCGVATGQSVLDAYQKALRCDPVSAFGGIVAVNHAIDAAAAEAIVNVFTEVIIAPGADEAAQDIIGSKKNLRLLLTDAMPDPTQTGLAFKSVSGGLLVQSRDAGHVRLNDLKTVTKRAPSEQELADLLFAFKVAKHVKSNAIIYAKDGATVGIGAGQMSRVDSARIAALKSGDAAESAGLDVPLAKGSVVASDAFFPFADGLLQAVEAGATAVIQPGGSMRDEDVIAAADQAGLAMVFTGMRHFRH